MPVTWKILSPLKALIVSTWYPLKYTEVGTGNFFQLLPFVW